MALLKLTVFTALLAGAAFGAQIVGGSTLDVNFGGSGNVRFNISLDDGYRFPLPSFSSYDGFLDMPQCFLLEPESHCGSFGPPLFIPLNRGLDEGEPVTYYGDLSLIVTPLPGNLITLDSPFGPSLLPFSFTATGFVSARPPQFHVDPGPCLLECSQSRAT